MAAMTTTPAAGTSAAGATTSSATTTTYSPQDAFARIRSRLSDQAFLEGKGLGNEVPFFIHPYDARAELEVRRLTQELLDASRANEIPARVVHFDLWEVFLDICRARNVLEKIPQLEKRRGTDALLDSIGRFATPEAFVQAMDTRYQEGFGGPEPGRDVVLVSGVGKAYPLMRAHSILENAQPVFTDVPLVMLYPGSYDGQRLRLFGSIDDGNYYRAFSLM